jgi:hypothetical protein
MYAKRVDSYADGQSSDKREDHASRSDYRSAPPQPVAGFVVLGFGLGIGYHAWPGGIGDVPLASLTLAMISQAVYAVSLALMASLIAGNLWGLTRNLR